MDRVPNTGASGAPTFRASFVSTTRASAFQIAAFQPNPLFSGQMIYLATPPADILKITFNELVTRVELVFATVEPGRLSLSAPRGGKASVDSATVAGGDFEGGTLVYSDAVGFNTIDLQAFTDANIATLFAIDNLSATIIPEPCAAVLAVVLSTSLMFRRRPGVV
jgi:hypothetical protein